MGQLGQVKAERLERAAGLFQLSGKIYPVRVGRRQYIRLQFYTADVDEQRLLESCLGGRFMLHVGRIHMWEAARRADVGEALTRLAPYLTGVVGAQALIALQWAYAPTVALRYEKVEELRQHRIRVAQTKVG